MSIPPSFRSLIRYQFAPQRHHGLWRSSLNRRLSLLNSALRILNNPLRDLPLMLGRLLRLLWERAILNTLMIREDAPNLGSPDTEQEEIHRRQAVVAEIKSAHSDPASLLLFLGGSGVMGQGTYKMFLGLMTKHQRVQIAPVAISARFWVRERDSAGRAKSDMPVSTTPHYIGMGGQRGVVGVRCGT